MTVKIIIIIMIVKKYYIIIIPLLEEGERYRKVSHKGVFSGSN